MNDYGRRTEDISLTEIVRREVKIAIKEMLGQIVRDERENLVKSGDFQPQETKPLDDTIGRPHTKDANNVSTLPLPVKVTHKNGVVEHRRAKRTQAEMREAILKAIPQVKVKHPDWSDKRVRRLAKNLVRRYKI